jgi:hypothetical protein
MKTLIANMKHAARNQESVHIGGGLFSPEELLDAIKQFEALETAALAALEEPCEGVALLRQALQRNAEK